MPKGQLGQCCPMLLGGTSQLGQCCPLLGETSYNPRLEPRFNPSAAQYYQNVGELMYNPASTQLTEPFALGNAASKYPGYIVPGYGTGAYWPLGRGRPFGWFDRLKFKIKQGIDKFKFKIKKKGFGLGETVANPADTGRVKLKPAALGYAESGSVWMMGQKPMEDNMLGYMIGPNDYIEYGSLGHAAGGQNYGALGYPTSGQDYGAMGYAASSQDYGALGGALNTIYGLAGLAGAGLGAYHGYKRNNDSIGWAVGWGLFGSVLPILAIPIAVAQGIGKPKMRRNRGFGGFSLGSIMRNPKRKRKKRKKARR